MTDAERKAKQRHRSRLRRGWVVVRNVCEIPSAVGSMCYEWMTADGFLYGRRID